MLLTRTLKTSHFRPESVYIPGSLRGAAPPQSRQKRRRSLSVEEGGGADRTTNSTSQGKEAVANLSPIPQLQVGPSFKIRIAVDITEETTG